MGERSGLQDEVAALRAEVGRLQAVVAALVGDPRLAPAAAPGPVGIGGTAVSAAPSAARPVRPAPAPLPFVGRAGRVPVEQRPPLSRRRLLAALPGVAVAGAGVAALGGIVDPQPASATAGSPVVLGASNDAGSATTTLSSTSDAVLQVGDPQTDPDGVALAPGSVAVTRVNVTDATSGPSALSVGYQQPDVSGYASFRVLADGATDPFVSVQGYQVSDYGSSGSTALLVSSIGPASVLQARAGQAANPDGSSTPGTALDAAADGAGTGLLVASQSGRAIQASTTSGTASADAVVVTTAGLGRGVYASATNSKNVANVVTGVTAGSGAGVSGTSTSTSLAGTGVVGQAGAAGRGGRFKGGAAAVQLTPGTASTHPTTGQAGDLMVDSTSRLWFCQKSSAGSTAATWKQLA